MGAGGGATQTSDVPLYLRGLHQELMAHGVDVVTPTDSLTRSMFQALNTAYAINPFTSGAGYDPFNPVSPEGSTVAPSRAASSALGNIETEADTFAAVVDGLAYKTDWDDIVDRVNTKRSSIFDAPDTIFNKLGATLTNAITAAISEGITAYKAHRDDTKLDMTTLINNATDKVTSILEAAAPNALAAAQAAIADTAVTNAVTQYETDQLGVHLRGVARFAGGMAAQNAVLGNSGFVIGLALTEQQQQNDVNKFSADLKLDIYRNTYRDFLTNLMNMSIKYMDNYQTIVDGYLKAFVSTLTAYLDTWSGRYLQSEKAKDIMLLQGSADLIGMYDRQVKHDLTKAELNTKAEVLWIAAARDYASDRLSFEVHKDLWYLDALQYGSNLLAAVSGASSITKQPGMTRTQSVLSGVMAGASIGASAGGSFLGLPGVVAGGLIGGLAGLL